MSVDKELLIECSSQEEADKVFEHLKSKGEVINPTYFTFNYSAEWNFISYYEIIDKWTIARKSIDVFGNKVISAKEFLNTSPEKKSLVGRWVKFLKQVSTKCPIGSYDLITEDCHNSSCIILKKYEACGRGRLTYGEIELMPEGWSPDSETSSKDEFIVGKWYKCDDWYGKFECIHNSGKRIKFSETIINNIYSSSTHHLNLVD